MRFRAVWNFLSTLVTIAVLGFFLMGSFSDVSPIDVEMIKRVCGDKDTNCQTSDAYWIAVQIGRLDIISICLAILGVSVALSAMFGFLYVKEKSELVASKAAKETIDELSGQIEIKIEKNAISFMEENLPKIVQDYLELTKSSADGGGVANDIAGNVDEEGRP